MRRRRRRRKRLLLLLLFILSIVPSVATSVVTLSLFGDRAVQADGAWGPVPVDVEVSPQRLLDVTGMLPGDSARAELRIGNPGAMPLNYAMMVAATNPDGSDLRSALIAELRAAGCAEAGEVLYLGPLADARLGDPAAGPQPGDRRLAPTSNERLCLEVRLPERAANAYATATTSVTVSVVAEQGVVE